MFIYGLKGLFPPRHGRRGCRWHRLHFIRVHLRQSQSTTPCTTFCRAAMPPGPHEPGGLCLGLVPPLHESPAWPGEPLGVWPASGSMHPTPLGGEGGGWERAPTIYQKSSRGCVWTSKLLNSSRWIFYLGCCFCRKLYHRQASVGTVQLLKSAKFRVSEIFPKKGTLTQVPGTLRKTHLGRCANAYTNVRITLPNVLSSKAPSLPGGHAPLAWCWAALSGLRPRGWGLFPTSLTKSWPSHPIFERFLVLLLYVFLLQILSAKFWTPEHRGVTRIQGTAARPSPGHGTLDSSFIRMLLPLRSPSLILTNRCLFYCRRSQW